MSLYHNVLYVQKREKGIHCTLLSLGLIVLIVLIVLMLTMMNVCICTILQRKGDYPIRALACLIHKRETGKSSESYASTNNLSVTNIQLSGETRVWRLLDCIQGYIPADMVVDLFAYHRNRVEVH